MNSKFPIDEPEGTEPNADNLTQFSVDEDQDGLEYDDALDFELTEGAARGSGPVGVLGEYLLLESIGLGGMGEVFRAEHRTMNREVALKILSKQIANRRELLEQFYLEIRAVAKLMHPNIVTAFDAGCAGSTHYLVMELVKGEILSSRVRNRGPLPTSEAVSVLQQAGKALSYAHGLGVVHRDIKPSNLMLTQDGILKILDFGLARLGATGAAERNKNMFMGTPEYMSPEQIENPDSVDGRSDLYSLGATLFFLLTGKALFTGDQMQVARAQLHQKPTPLFVARNDVDLRLDAVFQRLVAKRPEDRYASAQELLSNLKSLNLTSKPSASGELSRGAFRLGTDSPTSVAFDKSTLAKKSQIMAIDLGLLTSSAAYYDKHLGPVIIPQGSGGSQTIRNILWSQGEQIKVGAEASELRQTQPELIFHSVQRWLGTQRVSRPFGGKQVPPEVLLATILRQIVQNSGTATDNSANAIVTVPSCYDQMHRRAIRNACKIAGIELMQLLDKPLAAALGWMDVNSRLESSTATDARLLIVHLGGTGLETSVVRIQGNTARQLGVGGHWKLGTSRWQRPLTEYFATTLAEQTGKSIKDDILAATRLQRTIELATERLTSSNKVEIRFDWEGAAIRQMVTQEGWVKTAPDLAIAIQQSIAHALSAAKTDPSEIDQILVAGSMMQMKPVQRIVMASIPHNIPLGTLDRADFARGAAIQAHFVGSLTAQDVLPRAVGCTAHDFAVISQAASPDSAAGASGRPRMILEKSAPLPSSITKTIRGNSDQPDKAVPQLQLIESTRLGDGNWLKLGNIRPNLAFPDYRGTTPLQLRLEVDESGILESSLIWPDGNKQTRIAATSDPELSKDDVEQWQHWLETLYLCSNP